MRGKRRSTNRQPLGGLREFVGCMLLFLSWQAAGRVESRPGHRYLQLVAVMAAVTPWVLATSQGGTS